MSAQAAWLEGLEEAENFTRWVADEIAPFLHGRALEIGCGTGTYTELLARRCEEVIAVEIDPAFAARTRERFADRPRVRVVEGDARLLPELGRFDTIVMLDVLEHIEDDVAMLRSLQDRLSPDGRLVLKVPASPALYGTLDSAIGHYRRYSRRTLSQTAAQAGLDLIACRPFNLAAAPGWWLNGRLLKRTHPPQAQLRLYDRLVPVFRAVDRLTGPPLGTSWIAAARRRGR